MSHSKQQIIGEEVAAKLNYTKFLDLLHASSDAAAFVDATFTRKSLTHKRLCQFIHEDFYLPEVTQGARVCVCLPNLPELGTCLISLLATQRVVFPLNPAMTSVEMEWEISNTRCIAVIALASQVSDHASAATPASSVLTAAANLQLPVYAMQPSAETTGLFSISLVPSSLHVVSFSETDDTVTAAPSPHTHHPAPSSTVKGAQRHPELVMLLYTSGTSGRKKLVPYSLDMLVSGVSCIIASVSTVSLNIFHHTSCTW